MSVGPTELDVEVPARPARAALTTGRWLHALALALLALAVLSLYGVEAALRKTPWLFTDELEWSQLSRSIASTGHAARRGESHSFESLYSFLIAPAWWIHSTAAAYAAIKYLNAVVMCLAAFPAYLLARSLVERRVALAVALLSIVVPAMSYATSIVPEPLAYLWFTFAAFSAVRALAAPSTRTVVPAVALAAAGMFVRLEFVILPATLVVSAAVLWVVGRSQSLSWRRVVVGCAGVAVFGFAFNAAVVDELQGWAFASYFNHETVTQGGLAVGALAIGLGVMPIICGIASLWLPERFGDDTYRAFAVYLGSSILIVFVYTAAKAAFLFTSLRPTIEERNLFYLSPLLLTGTALALTAQKLNWFLVDAAAVLALLVTWSGKLVVGAPYFDAPGLAILTLANREFRWDIKDFHVVLGAAALATIVLLSLRHHRGVRAIAMVLLLVWLVTGEIYATKGNTDEANVFATAIPQPRSWVDAAVGAAHVTVLGQNITPAAGNPLWLTEFWNRSVDHVASLNGVAPGPGPVLGPGLDSVGGALSGYTGDAYTLAGNGVRLDAPIVGPRRDGFTLYHTPTRWRLLDEEQNVYTDGWATSPIGYTYFPLGGPGVLTIHLSRSGYPTPGPPSRATIRVGTVELDPNGNPILGRVLAIRHVLVHNGELTVVPVHVAATPVTVSVTMDTFRTPTDSRSLAAQPSFRFVPDDR